MLKEFAVDGARVALPTAHATFPARCLACGAPARTTVELYRQRGLDLIIHKAVRFVKLSIPTCAACKRRKGLLHAGFVAPSIAVVAWWALQVSSGDRQLSQSQLEPFTLAFAAAFLFAYYGARRLAEHVALGVRIVEMSVMGDSLELRCRSSHDAMEIAELSRRRAGIAEETGAATLEPMLRALAANGDRLELRYSAKKIGLFLSIGVACLLAMYAMAINWGYSVDIIWLIGAAFAVTALRLFDRRALVTLGPDGIVYRPWGTTVLAWREIESVRLVNDQLSAFVDVRPHAPEQLEARMSGIQRFKRALLSSGRPRFAIDLTLLDCDPPTIVAWIESRVRAGL